MDILQYSFGLATEAIAMEHLLHKQVAPISIDHSFQMSSISNNLIISFIVFGCTNSQMQQFATASNRVVFCVDWGSSGLSCYGYLQIIICLIDKIVDLFVYWLTKCLNIRTLKMFGHSLGAQIIGYVAQRLKALGLLVQALYGLDPAGPGFMPPLRCQGIVNGCAEYVAVFHSDPGGLGTIDLTIGNSIVLLNKECLYCQEGCNCIDLSCSHTYVLEVIRELFQNIPITGIRIANPLSPCVGTAITLTVNENMPNGYYCANTYGTQTCPLDGLNVLKTVLTIL